MKVEKTRGFKVYNVDQGKVQELLYPGIITMSAQTDKVAQKSREAEIEAEKRRAKLLMSVAQDEIVEDPVVRASSQFEGGFFVDADPDEVAFFECNFKPPETRKGKREKFGFNCRPITMGMIGGPENWLYGHQFREACKQVYDRETGEVVPKPEDEKFIWHNLRYYCGCDDAEIKEYQRKWGHALEKLREYDDLIRFSAKNLEDVDLSEMWDVEERLMEQLKETKEERELEALKTFIQRIFEKKKYEPTEEFRKLFIRRYGFGLDWEHHSSDKHSSGHTSNPSTLEDMKRKLQEEMDKLR